MYVRIEFENGCSEFDYVSRILMKGWENLFFQQDAYISVDFWRKSRSHQNEKKPEHPTDFDMIIENADGENLKFYLNILIFNRIMLFRRTEFLIDAINETVRSF